MKKFLNLILLGCGTLLALLIFATMAGTAIKVTGSFVTFKSGSVYDFVGGSEPYGLAVTCIIFVVLISIAGIAAVVFTLLKQFDKYNHFIALGAAVLAFVTAILFFSFATGDLKGADLGVGCVLSGIFALLSAAAFGTFGALALMKKK